MHRFVPLSAAVLALATGCNRFEYTHGFSTVALRPGETTVGSGLTTPDGDDHVQLEHSFDVHTNEIILADDTGVGCAAVATAGEQASAEAEAIEAAQAAGQTYGTVEYWYRVHSPAEYEGILCGVYYRRAVGSGSVETTALNEQNQVVVESVDAKLSGYELGLYLGGADTLAGLSWLRWSLEFRLGFGNFDIKAEETTGVVPNMPTGDTYVTLPIRMGLMFFPEFLFGLGVVADAGVDPFAWAFSDSGSVVEKIDLSARLEWDYGNPYFGVGVFGGWQARHVGWGDMWVNRSGLFVGGYLALHFDGLFG